MASRDIHIAKTSALVFFDGRRVKVTKGKTFVREGHDLLKQYPDLFTKLVPQYEVIPPRPKPAPKKTKKEDPKPAEPSEE